MSETHVELMFNNNNNWHTKETHAWTLNYANAEVITDMGMAEYAKQRYYDSNFNEKSQQFEIKIYSDGSKDKTHLFDVSIKYNQSTKQLESCCTHLNTKSKCVTKYVKKA